MHKLIIGALVWALPALAINVSDNSGQNLTSVKILPTVANPIGTYFMYNVPGFPFGPTNISANGASTVSMVMNNLTGPNYSHILVNNTSNFPLALTMTTQPVAFPAVPSTNMGRVLYVVSNGYAAYDGLPMWTNLYIQSNNGQSVMNGEVDVILWGSNNTRGGTN